MIKRKMSADFGLLRHPLIEFLERKKKTPVTCGNSHIFSIQFKMRYVNKIDKYEITGEDLFNLDVEVLEKMGVKRLPARKIIRTVNDIKFYLSKY